MNFGFNSSITFNYLWSKNLEKNGKLINQPPIKIENILKLKTKNFWKITFSEISLSPSFTFNQFQAPITISPEDLIFGVVNITPDSEIFDFKELRM